MERVRLTALRLVRLVEAALLGIWDDLRSEAAEETASVKRRIGELEHRKKRFVEAYVVE